MVHLVMTRQQVLPTQSDLAYLADHFSEPQFHLYYVPPQGCPLVLAMAPRTGELLGVLERCPRGRPRTT